MFPDLEILKSFFPFLLGILGTLVAIKTNWIKSQFIKKQSLLDVALAEETVEGKALDNVERTLNIYRGVVDDLEATVGELREEIKALKDEIKGLKDFIGEQKDFIKKQSASLQYYEGKYGKIKE